MTTTRPMCRHGEACVVSRPRGLCWACYRRPGVKELYPSTSKYARRGVSNTTAQSKLPDPTDAAPGTPEKVAVMEARAARGEALFHPEDAPDTVGKVVRGRLGGVVHRLTQSRLNELPEFHRDPWSDYRVRGAA